MNPELPAWPGAAGAYARAHRILGAMARAGHVERRGGRCYPSPEMLVFIDALNRGDEAAVKGFNIEHAAHDRAMQIAR